MMEVCSYFNLRAVGAKHSGDIRSIPNKKGTAEYIELDLNELNRAGALYVAFTCNAYSNGAISPNLVVGWMDSAYPMKIQNEQELLMTLPVFSIRSELRKACRKVWYLDLESEGKGNRMAGNTFWRTDGTFIGS